MPTAKQRRATHWPRRRGGTGRLIVVAWPDCRRVAAKSEIGVEILLCAFGEHRSPPSAVQPEASVSGQLNPSTHRLAVNCAAIDYVVASPAAPQSDGQVGTTHLRSATGLGSVVRASSTSRIDAYTIPPIPGRVPRTLFNGGRQQLCPIRSAK